MNKTLRELNIGSFSFSHLKTNSICEVTLDKDSPLKDKTKEEIENYFREGGFIEISQKDVIKWKIK